MTKRNTIFKNFLLTLLIMLISSTCFMLTACNEEPTVYKLYQYEAYSDTYDLGDSFYDITITADLVKLTLDEDGEAELCISIGFLEGDAEYLGNYRTYKGSYTETDTEILATFPEFNSTALRAVKTGNLISIQLSSYVNLIMKK